MAVATPPAFYLASSPNELHQSVPGVVSPPSLSFRGQLFSEQTSTSDSTSTSTTSWPKSHTLGRAFRKLVHKLKRAPKEPDNPTPTTTELPSSLQPKSSFKAASNLFEGSRPQLGNATRLEQSIATIRSASFRKQRRRSRIELIDETWEDWLDDYRKGDRNLSKVGRPTSFCGLGHMAPPMHVNETSRLRVVDKVKNHGLWKPEMSWLSRELRHLLSQYRLKNACVSIIDRTMQQNMLEIGFANHLYAFGRELSLDAHSILSKDYFALLDASVDWRTRLNPLVHGPPFIKFYLGVPLTVNNMAIGCISVSDPYLKVNVMPEMIHKLKEISKKLATNLEARIKPKYYGWGNISRIQWGEETDELSSKVRLDLDSIVLDASDISDNRRPNLCEDSTSEGCSINSTISASPQLPQPTTIHDLPSPVYNANLQPLSCRSLIQPFQVFESLLKCKTVPHVIKKACRLVKQNLGADLVYIAEVRGDAAHQPSSLRAASGAGSAASTSHLHSNSGVSQTHVQLVNYCMSEIVVDVQERIKGDHILLESAIASKYGIQYLANEFDESEFKTGLVIPFRRDVPSASSHLTAGGFIMAAFNMQSRFISPGDKAFAKKVVSALENILACHEELNGTSTHESVCD